MSWEKDLEEWRKSYRKYISIRKQHGQTIQRIKKKHKLEIDLLNRKIDLLDRKQEGLYKEDFTSLQLNKIKPRLMKLLVGVPFNKSNNTEIKSLTDVSLYTVSKNSRSAREVVRFEFEAVTKDVSRELIFDTEIYPIKNTEILKKFVDFKPPTMALVKTVLQNATTVPNGNCDVCGHVFSADPNKKYFPVHSTVDDTFWCCHLCKKFLDRYLEEERKEQTRAVSRAKMLPMGLKL